VFIKHKSLQGFCILDRYGSFPTTSDRQFGFKKGVGCNFAIRSVRNVVDMYVAHGNRPTANLCAIDVSKAFDRVITLHC